MIKSRLSFLFNFLKFYMILKRLLEQYFYAKRELSYWQQKKEELLKLSKIGYRISIEDLGLDENYFTLLQEAQMKSHEVIIGEIDQDGYLLSYFGPIKNIPTVSLEEFLPRKRFNLYLVSIDGFVGIKKNYKGDKVSFLNEMKALYLLGLSGCRVPTILDIDFDNLTLTFSYILGNVLSEELAKKGAVLRDRDIEKNPDFSNLSSTKRRLRWIQEGRRVLYNVITPRFVDDLVDELNKIRSSGFILNDIKYGNIIIERHSGKPYLIDFDMACYCPNMNKKLFRVLCKQDMDEFALHFNVEKNAR